jgi:FAD/FMN-containing dehydrogenase
MTLDTLRDLMPALVPGDDGYDDAAISYHVPGSPIAVLRPLDADGVAAAVRWATGEGHAISIRSGGHTAWGTNEGGVVIDLGSLDRIGLGDDGLVRVGGGAVWGDIAEALAPHGLALSSGDTASVGVGGLTLGGGIGWLVRSQGLALDNLVGVKAVTAEGEIVRADAAENPDLFWALRGGGGNFAVVTEFAFRPHALAGMVIGTLVFDRERLLDVVLAWRDALRVAPDAWTSTLISMPGFGPGMPPSLQVVVAWAGEDLDAARAASAPLLEHPARLGGELALGSYRSLLDEAPPAPPSPAPTIVDESVLLRGLSDELLADVVGAHELLNPAVLMMRSLGGAFGRVARDATAFAHRDAEALVISAAFRQPGAPAEVVAEARGTWAAAVGDPAPGTYGNFRPTTSPEVVAAMYPPETLARLRAAKRAWDPRNVFAANHNILPA